MTANRPRRKRLFTMLIRSYAALDTGYEHTSSRNIALSYYSNGSTRLGMDRERLISTAPIPNRLDLILLTFHRRGEPTIPIAISADDYNAFQQAIQRFENDDSV